MTSTCTAGCKAETDCFEVVVRGCPKGHQQHADQDVSRLCNTYSVSFFTNGSLDQARNATASSFFRLPLTSVGRGGGCGHGGSRSAIPPVPFLEDQRAYVQQLQPVCLQRSGGRCGGGWGWGVCLRVCA